MTEVDVVIVGGGGSGLAAAITAAESGATTLILEKRDQTGGTTSMSVGSFSAAGTSMQRAAGVDDDSPEQFQEDMCTSNGDLEDVENRELRVLLSEHAAETFEWVRSLGVEFFGPTPEPPFRHPRMHNVVPNSRAYAVALERAARRAGVAIHLGVRVDGLLRDGERVVGVTAGGVAYRARRAVVLATGDYSANEELKRTWASPQVGRIPAINPDSTGDGFTMGMAVGAVPCNTWRTMDELRFHLPPGRRELIRRLPVGPRAARAMRIAIERLPRDVVGWFARSAMTSWVAPSAALFQSGAILVGPRGTRFGNELHHPARALTDEPENRCWLVIDAVMARRFAPGGEPVSTFPGIAYAYLRDYAKFRPDAHREATTPAELGAAVGVPGPALADTIDRYNRFVDAGVDDDFGRRELGPGLRAGPYVALGPLGAFVTLTEGGLLIDDECHVLDRDGGRIDGLLAVGSTGQGGLILRNHGLHIAWALTSGRLAGRVAARATATSVASS